MFYVYWALWVFLLLLIVWSLYEEKRTVMRLVYGIMIIPFLLRVLLLK